MMYNKLGGFKNHYAIFVIEQSDGSTIILCPCCDWSDVMGSWSIHEFHKIMSSGELTDKKLGWRLYEFLRQCQRELDIYSVSWTNASELKDKIYDYFKLGELK